MLLKIVLFIVPFPPYAILHSFVTKIYPTGILYLIKTNQTESNFVHIQSRCYASETKSNFVYIIEILRKGNEILIISSEILKIVLFIDLLLFVCLNVQVYIL